MSVTKINFNVPVTIDEEKVLTEKDTIEIDRIVFDKTYNTLEDTFGENIYVISKPLSDNIISIIRANPEKIAIRFNYKIKKRNSQDIFKKDKNDWGFVNSLYRFDSGEYFNISEKDILNNCLIKITEDDLETHGSKTYIKKQINMVRFYSRTILWDCDLDEFEELSGYDCDLSCLIDFKFAEKLTYNYLGDSYISNNLYQVNGNNRLYYTSKFGIQRLAHGVYDINFRYDSKTNFFFTTNYSGDRVYECMSMPAFCKRREGLLNVIAYYINNGTSIYFEDFRHRKFTHEKYTKITVKSDRANYNYSRYIASTKHDNTNVGANRRVYSYKLNFVILKDNYYNEHDYMYEKVFPIYDREIETRIMLDRYIVVNSQYDDAIEAGNRDGYEGNVALCFRTTLK